MREGRHPLQGEIDGTAADLRLLVAAGAWSSVFLQNLIDLFRKNEVAALPGESTPDVFWPDVFVERSLPWLRFLQSGTYHVLLLAGIWAGSRFLASQSHVAVSATTFTHADVLYYTPSEYLPPLDTRSSSPARSQKSDPEYSAQPIISVPPEADNPSQTVVTPPRIQLQNDVAFPNVVALLQEMPSNPRMPIGPAPV